MSHESEPRIADAAEFASLNRVLLIRDRDGVDIDVSLGAMPFEEQAIQRASEYTFSTDCRILTCSATDLVILKAFAALDRDWRDIESVLIRSSNSVNWQDVVRKVQELAELKDDLGIVERLKRLKPE